MIIMHDGLQLLHYLLANRTAYTVPALLRTVQPWPYVRGICAANQTTLTRYCEDPENFWQYYTRHVSLWGLVPATGKRYVSWATFVVYAPAALCQRLNAQTIEQVWECYGWILQAREHNVIIKPLYIVKRSDRTRQHTAPRRRTIRTGHPWLRGEQSLSIYLEEIGRVPLLTPDEEVYLSEQIHLGDEEALETMIVSNLRFVVSIAKQYRNRGVAFGDLINEGNIGLCKAAKLFDETRGFRFISYAVWWIRQAILKALAEHSRVVRLPKNRVAITHKVNKADIQLAQELGKPASIEQIAAAVGIPVQEALEARQLMISPLSFDQPFNSDQNSNTFHDIFQDERPHASPSKVHATTRLGELIQQALDTLTEREAEIITRYFGLADTPSQTLDEIGDKFGITRERVRQIKERALTRLRLKSRSVALRSYFDS